jgi:hypothetical protein
VQVAQRCAHPNIVATHMHCLTAHHQDAAQHQLQHQQQEWLGPFQGSAPSSAEWLIQVEPKPQPQPQQQQQQQQDSSSTVVGAPGAAMAAPTAAVQPEAELRRESGNAAVGGDEPWGAVS